MRTNNANTMNIATTKNITMLTRDTTSERVHALGGILHFGWQQSALLVDGRGGSGLHGL